MQPFNLSVLRTFNRSVQVATFTLLNSAPVARIGAAMQPIDFRGDQRRTSKSQGLTLIHGFGLQTKPYGQAELASARLWKSPHLIEEGEALSDFGAVEYPSAFTLNRPPADPAPPTGGGLVWLAAYTTPRHEKAVARHLSVREVDYYLPLYRTVRRWRNGCHVPVESPVFPNYIFVHTSQQSSSRLLEIPGLLAFVGAGGNATPLPDAEMERLRIELPLRKSEPNPYLTLGSKVRIAAGPLAGYSGILQLRKNAIRVVLSVDLIRQSVAVEVRADEVESL